MSDAGGHVGPCGPVEAYVLPIRSVLFIDDQFPTFGRSPPHEVKETVRARALWQVCTERGWLCDVDNSPDWNTAEKQRRLAACDLLVLDFHLDGDNSAPALIIIQQLALSTTPNMVVVYTRDEDLDDVLFKAASWARGVRDDALAIEMTEDLEELEELVEWSTLDLAEYLSNGTVGASSLNIACENARLQRPAESSCAALVERLLRRAYKAEPTDEIRRIERLGHAEHKWFQCGNLFLAVIGKPAEQEAASEAESLLGGLEGAVRDWKPSWLACDIASSRRQVEIGAFRDDSRLLEEPLKRGLLGYISGSESESERLRRSKEVANSLLSKRFDRAAAELGQRLLTRSTSGTNEYLDETATLHLNTYLCSESFSHHHIHVGTIFAEVGTETKYWLCVTPACDMVPRKPDKVLNPWAARLYPFRPMLALRLTRISDESKIRRALKEAHLGRNLFFWDPDREPHDPIVAACFNRRTADPNPMLEQMIAVDQARVSERGTLRLRRCINRTKANGEAEIALHEVECFPVAQLRPPYSERVVHVVGGHVSRIGVDFVRFRPSS